MVGTETPGAAVRVTLRYDVPDPRQPTAAAALAGHAVGVLTAQGVTTAVAVGYGSDAAVSPVAAALRERAAEAGVTLTEVLRAEGQRYWSYVCANPACCPPEGTPYDVTGHPAARALRGGRRPGAGGPGRAVRHPRPGGRAARRGDAPRDIKAHAQVARCVTRLDRAGLHVTAARLTGALGQVAVRDAIRRYRDGEQVGPEHAAWLTVALRQLRVRDDAWARMEPEHRSAHLRLWTDLTRLARPGYVAAPAVVARLLRLAGRRRGAGQRRPRPCARRQPRLLDGPAAARGARLGRAARHGAAADDTGRGRRRLRRRGSGGTAG